MGAGYPAKTVSPEQYTAGMCTAMGDFQTAAFGNQDEIAALVMGGKPRFADIRRSMVAYYGEMARVSRRTAREIRALGTPDMRDGRAIARGMVRLFERIH